MPAQAGVASVPMLDANPDTTRRLRNRSVANLLRMGHCAPAVMQTLLDVSDTEAEWLVKLTAGLPGGIGNTGQECGGVTAPLLLLSSIAAFASCAHDRHDGHRRGCVRVTISTHSTRS
jgi:hypothetical protein